RPKGAQRSRREALALLPLSTQYVAARAGDRRERSAQGAKPSLSFGSRRNPLRRERATEGSAALKARSPRSPSALDAIRCGESGRPKGAQRSRREALALLRLSTQSVAARAGDRRERSAQGAKPSLSFRSRRNTLRRERATEGSAALKARSPRSPSALDAIRCGESGRPKGAQRSRREALALLPLSTQSVAARAGDRRERSAQGAKPSLSFR